MSKGAFYIATYRNGTTHLHKCSSSITHTYTSDAHHTSSTIDHILSPKHLLDRFSHSQVLTDEPLNLSDHSPVCATFLCSIPKTPISPDHQNTAKYCPNWAKASGTDLLHEYIPKRYPSSCSNCLTILSPPSLCPPARLTGFSLR